MKEIIKTSLQIQDQFPELTKYIPEMPETPDGSQPGISPESLSRYNDSLKALLDKYAGQQVIIRKRDRK